MKKIIFAVATVSLMIFIVASCKKDKTLETKTQTPMQTTIKEMMVVDSVRISTTNSGELDYIEYHHGVELGHKIYFKRKGRITKLGCNMPSAGAYNVSLWDFNSRNNIVSVNVYNPGIQSIVPYTGKPAVAFAYVTISPVEVNANSRYVISVNNGVAPSIGRQPYQYSKKDNANTIYPFTTGSAVYEQAFLKLNVTEPTFPTESYIRYAPSIYGVADVEFEYEE